MSKTRRARRGRVALAAACGLAAIPLVSASPVAAASTLTVTEGEGTGEGSLPWAIDEASDNPSVRRINIDVEYVDLCGGVVYDGSQSLTIDGNGAEVYLNDPYSYACAEEPSMEEMYVTTTTALPPSEEYFYGPDAVLTFITGGNIRLRDLTVETGNGHGGYADAGGILLINDTPRSPRHNLTDVDVYGVSGFGVLATDLEGPGGVFLTALRVNVWEVGPAEFFLYFGNESEIGIGIGQAAVGIGILESGNGAASLNARTVRAWDIAGPAIGVSEYDGGNAVVRLFSVDAESSLGAIITEWGSGNLSLAATNVAIEDTFNGLLAYEGGSGNLVSRITNASFSNDDFFVVPPMNGAALEAPMQKLGFEVEYGCYLGELCGLLGDGVALIEDDLGNLRSTMNNVEANGNSDDGVKIEEYGGGSLVATLSRVTANNNWDDGADIEEHDAGRATVRLWNSEFLGNDDYDVCIDPADPLVVREFNTIIGVDCLDGGHGATV